MLSRQSSVYSGLVFVFVLYSHAIHAEGDTLRTTTFVQTLGLWWGGKRQNKKRLQRLKVYQSLIKKVPMEISIQGNQMTIRRWQRWSIYIHLMKQIKKWEFIRAMFMYELLFILLLDACPLRRFCRPPHVEGSSPLRTTGVIYAHTHIYMLKGDLNYHGTTSYVNFLM